MHLLPYSKGVQFSLLFYLCYMGHIDHGMYDAVWTGNYAIYNSTDNVLVFPINSFLPKVRLS